MLEVHVLASGSSGNCSVIEYDGEAVMVDAGLSYKRLSALMDQEGVDRGMIKAILVTHEHSDHVAGVGATARKLDVPVITNTPTFDAFDAGKVDFIPMDSRSDFDVGLFHVTPLPTSHDAVEPNAFFVQCGGGNVLIATDTGFFSFQIMHALEMADIAVVEANYDPVMLRDGPYPLHLKRRIASDIGHMSNFDCGKAVKETMSDRSRKIFLAHLSEHNNTPDLARQTVADVSGITRRLLDCLEFRGDTRTITN